MNSMIVSSVLTFLVGIGVGMLIQRYVVGRGSKVAQLESELTRVQGEQLHMKDTLQQHFKETADLTQSLTNNYKALYEHLAKGAHQFTEQPLADFQQLLQQPLDQSATIESSSIDYAEAGLDPEAVRESEESTESEPVEKVV